MKVSK